MASAHRCHSWQPLSLCSAIFQLVGGRNFPQAPDLKIKPKYRGGGPRNLLEVEAVEICPTFLALTNEMDLWDPSLAD